MPQERPTSDFFGEKAAIGNILPIFNPANLNLELLICSATVSKLKSIGIDNFLKWQKRSEWVFSWIYCSWSCVAKKAMHKGPTYGVAAKIPHQIICQGGLMMLTDFREIQDWMKLTDTIAMNLSCKLYAMMITNPEKLNSNRSLG